MNYATNYTSMSVPMVKLNQTLDEEKYEDNGVLN